MIIVIKANRGKRLEPQASDQGITPGHGESDAAALEIFAPEDMDRGTRWYENGSGAVAMPGWRKQAMGDSRWRS